MGYLVPGSFVFAAVGARSWELRSQPEGRSAARRARSSVASRSVVSRSRLRPGADARRRIVLPNGSRPTGPPADRVHSDRHVINPANADGESGRAGWYPDGPGEWAFPLPRPLSRAGTSASGRVERQCSPSWGSDDLTPLRAPASSREAGPDPRDGPVATPGPGRGAGSCARIGTGASPTGSRNFRRPGAGRLERASVMVNRVGGTRPPGPKRDRATHRGRRHSTYAPGFDRMEDRSPPSAFPVPAAGAASLHPGRVHAEVRTATVAPSDFRVAGFGKVETPAGFVAVELTFNQPVSVTSATGSAPTTTSR